MRVVLATDARTAGGVGRHLRDLAEGLRARQVEVSLAAPGGSGIAGVAADLGLRFTAFEAGLDRADVWHLHLADTFYRPSVPLLLRARRAGRRVVVTEHLPRSNASDAALSPDPRTPGAALAKTVFKRGQLGLAHSVIAVSEGSRRFLIGRYGLSARRVTGIHNGVDLDRFTPSDSPRPSGGRGAVVAVGSLIRQKGHDVLIRAAARSRLGWDVVIAGTGPQEPDLRRLAGSEAPGRVRFAGWVDDIPRLMREAALVCLPSRWESFAYVPLEAMAMGLPVVAARVDGVDEVVTHESSGLLVRPDDPEALAAAVDRVLGEAGLAESLGRNARRDVTGFGLARMTDMTLNHYRSLL